MSALTYRLATTKDTKTLANWWRDGRVMEHAGFPYGLTIDEEKLEERLKKQTKSSHQVFILEYDQKPIGEMGVKTKDDQAEIGIKICEETYQNKGLGSKVLRQLITDLFQQANIRLIKLDTMVENVRAQKVYERLGFKKIKTEDDVFVDQLGRSRSAVFYQMAKDDCSFL